ncbi:MAG TPA: MAPEG family protein [Polyangiales bacterium]|nr:MAPEG family protein [Polyangiales bacterium]
MNQDLLLWPLVAHVLLVLWLFIRLGQVKDRARASGLIDPTVTALDNDAWPEDVRKVANNMRNQFQVPVLFYVLVLVLFARGSVDLWALGLAWLFVASRFVHTYIHIGANYVPNRTRVFKLSVACVIGLTALVIRALLL